MLTELFVAEADRALELVEEGPALADDVPVAAANSVTEVTLASLHRIAAPGSPAATDVAASVSVDRWEGPWLQVIADEITVAIAAVGDDRLDEVAQTWASTDEWQDATVEDITRLVRELRDVARQASPERRLYLWTCL